jgi:hypothetical protein
MRERRPFFLCIGLGLLLAACGDGSSTGPDSPYRAGSAYPYPTGLAANPGSIDLRPFLDKRLVMTRYQIADSNGLLLKEVCGGQGEACEFDPVYFNSNGKYLLDECGVCPPGEGLHENAEWAFDAGRSQILMKGKDDTAWSNIGVVKASDDSLKLAYSMKLVHTQVSRSMGEEPHPETIRDTYMLLTYSPE